MRRFLIILVFCNFCAFVQAQFDYQRLSFRAGYNFHNSPASRFNNLVNEFNNRRYPLEIQYNLGSLNFQRGYVFGLDYEMNPEMSLHSVFKSRQQFLETRFSASGKYLGYFFRNTSLELGLQGKIQDEKWFSHFGGAGILLGTLSAFTQYGNKRDFASANHMLNIDRSFVLGLSLSYEARFKFSKFAALYLRPVVQYALPTQLRNLDEFLNPIETDEGIRFLASPNSAFNKGSLNGIGIEGGILISPWNGR